METNFLIIGIIGILLIYLIFKLIKKVIIAVISAILVIIIIFVGIIGFAAYDVQTLMETTDYEVQIIYLDNQNFIFGNSIQFIDSEPDLEKIKNIKQSDFALEKIENLKKSDNKFVVTFQTETIKQILDKENYELKFLKISELEDLDPTLTNKELFQIIESTDATNTLIDILIEKNEIDPVIGELRKPAIKIQIEKELEKFGISLNQAILLTSLEIQISDNSLNILEILTAYKEEKIIIYPDRFSFSLVRMLPSSIIENFINNNKPEPEKIE